MPVPRGDLTQIGTATVTVADQALTSLGVAVTGTAPGGSDLVVEVAVPDGAGLQAEFYLGGDAAGQSGPSFLYDPDCGALKPVDLALERLPDTHIIMQVVNKTSVVPTGMTVDAAGDGVITLGEQTIVAPSWTNNNGSQRSLVGTASNLTGPPDLTYSLVDAAADSGLIPAGATSNCADATGNCYAVQIDGTGFGHRDATMDEVPSLVVAPRDRSADARPPRRPELRGRRARKPLLQVRRDAAPHGRHERLRDPGFVLPGRRRGCASRWPCSC